MAKIVVTVIADSTFVRRSARGVLGQADTDAFAAASQAVDTHRALGRTPIARQRSQYTNVLRAAHILLSHRPALGIVVVGAGLASVVEHTFFF